MDHRQPLLSSPCGHRRAPGGFSLIEMVITLTITTVLLMTMYGFMVTQAMVTLDENTELSNQTQIRETAQQLFDELETCMPRRLDSMGAWFEYYLPQPTADANGDLLFGCSVDGVFYPNGFYSLAFVRSNEPQDLIKESTLAYNGGYGMDLNGNGTTTDVFVGGNLVISTFDSAGNPIGQPRTLYGKLFMELNPNPATGTVDTTYNAPTGQEDVDSSNAYTFKTQGTAGDTAAAMSYVNVMPYKASTAIFLMRQLNGVNAQHADAFNDLNNDGILDQGESYTDSNGNGKYDEADCEPFSDDNGNNVRDALEAYVDGNHNSKYDCRMTLQLTTFDSSRSFKAGDTADSRGKFFGLRVMQTKIRFKNLP